MKLETQQLEVTRSKDLKESEFTIKNCALAFDILSSKLYTNAALAIVRELSTNAYDSHVEAGKESVPFNVHLPNSFEPHFSIRDFGTGLSPEQVDEIYTKYFESTRTKSNKYGGGFGLGSKTPFAYCDQFTVTSYYNGKKYIYSMLKNEQGTPSKALLGELDTDEPNGLEIHLNIKYQDYNNFINSAKEVYYNFAVRPVITGASISYEGINTLYELDGKYKLITNWYGIRVIIGQVSYKVPDYTFTNSLTASGGLIIYADIGELSLAVTRESIQLDEKTIKIIQAKVDFACNNIAERIQEEFDNFPGSKIEKFKRNWEIKKYFRCATLENNIKLYTDHYSVDQWHLSYSNRLTRYGNSVLYYQSESYVILLNDVPEITSTIKGRLRKWLQEKPINDRTVILIAKEIKDQVEFEKVFGKYEIKLSELPKPVRAPRSGTSTKGVKRTNLNHIKKLENTGGSLASYFKKVTSFSDTEPNACTIPRNGNYVEWCNKPWQVGKILEYATFLGFKSVYAISHNYHSIRGALPDLETYAKKKTEEFFKAPTIQDLNKFIGVETFYGQFLHPIIEPLSYDICKKYIEMVGSNYIKNRFYWKELADNFEIDTNIVNTFSIDFFYERYPLLRVFQNRGPDGFTKDIVDYINLIEKV